jgi:hypothetical protein
MQISRAKLSSPFVNTAIKSSLLAALMMYLPDSMAHSFSPRFERMQIIFFIFLKNIYKKERRVGKQRD